MLGNARFRAAGSSARERSGIRQSPLQASFARSRCRRYYRLTTTRTTLLHRRLPSRHIRVTNSIYRGNWVIRIAKESGWKLANSSFTEIPLQRRIAEEKDKIFTSCAAFRGEGEEESDNGDRLEEFSPLDR